MPSSPRQVHDALHAYALGFPEACPPRPVLEDWIEESYRAVAPKTLVKRLDPS